MVLPGAAQRATQGATARRPRACPEPGSGGRGDLRGGSGGPARREAGATGRPASPLRLQWERLPRLQVPGPPEVSENAYYNLVGVFIFRFKRKLYPNN